MTFDFTYGMQVRACQKLKAGKLIGVLCFSASIEIHSPILKNPNPNRTTFDSETIRSLGIYLWLKTL